MLENYIQDPYLRALVLLIVSFIILRVAVFILEKIILKLTIKTKTNLDDLILKKSNNPLTWIIFFIGLKISFTELPFNEVTSLILQRILLTFAILAFTYLIMAVFSVSFSRVVKRAARKAKTEANEGMLQLMGAVIKIIIIIVAIIFILSYWGVEIGPLLAGIGIGGIAIAFALQSTLSNIFGGISIILDKSVNVGDLVNLDGGVQGRILDIGIRSTKVKTFDNEVIIVPNSKLASENIHNVGQPEPKSRVVIPFGVAYGTDVEKVKKIVLKEIKSVNNAVEDPEPTVKFLEMADSSINFKAYFFVNSFENRFNAIDEANTKIYNALNKAKIEIPFPQMDVHVKK
ncbi:mechanosensitive ion channel [archaeon]|jgi:MscS family membrane protein|nr:mechanosensitive ion channel [archaeon]